jgi:hypothetical protein
MVVIFIAIRPVELQPLRDFFSPVHWNAAFAPVRSDRFVGSYEN